MDPYLTPPGYAQAQSAANARASAENSAANLAGLAVGYGYAKNRLNKMSEADRLASTFAVWRVLRTVMAVAGACFIIGQTVELFVERGVAGLVVLSPVFLLVGFLQWLYRVMTPTMTARENRYFARLEA